MQARLYHLSQRLLGSSRSDRRLKALLDSGDPPRVILDVGGGTGISEPLVPRDSLYVCLDVDRERLAHFLAGNPHRSAVVADAAHLPFGTATIDLLLCRAVFHHLDRIAVAKLLAEGRRVLRPGGSMVWLEPVWRGGWLPGRVLWSLDRGAHPRGAAELRELIEASFEVATWHDYLMYHRYAMGSARPRNDPALPD